MGSDDDTTPTNTGTSKTGTLEANMTRNPRRNNNNSNKQVGGRGQQGNASGNGTGGFRGETTEMKGYVFEQPTRGNQYLETLAMLKRYSSVTYKSGRVLLSLFSAKPTQPTIKTPGAEPTATGKLGPDGKKERTTFDEEMFRLDIKAYRTELRELDHDLSALFAVIFGQCNQTLQATLMSQETFADREAEGDCLWLLTEIRSAATRFDKTLYIHDALHELRARFYREHQGTRTTVEYYRSFDALVKTLDDNHAWSLPPLKQDTDPSVRGSNDQSTQRNIRERELAAAFVLNADNKRFGTLKADLRDNYARGTNQWPRTLLDAYNLLVTQERNDAAARRHKNKREKDPSNTPPGNTPREKHPPRATDPHQFAMPRAHSSSLPSDGIPPGAILLDSESTCSIFRDSSLLSDIKDTDPPLVLNTNGGPHTSSKTGTYHGLGSPLTVWFNPNSIANVLALRDVRRRVQVTLDTAQELAFLVHIPDAPPIRFIEHDTGLYIHQPDNKDVKLPVTAYSYLQTVAKNRDLFTRREVRGADKARALYRHIGRPSQARFLQYLQKGLIRNCPITVDDAKRAHSIYGPDIAYIKGKTTQKPPLPHIETHIPLELQPHIAAHHRDITLCVDFFFIQQQAFLHVISRKIGYRTAVPVDNRSKTTILKTLRNEIKLYVGRGFIVRDVHGDGEFECVKDELLHMNKENGLQDLPGPIHLEVCTTNEHVKEVERSIRTIKDMLRATAHGMPYRRLPRPMIKGLVTYCVQNLNNFPYANGVSQDASPATIVRGAPPPDYNAFKLEFGAYVLVTDKTTNTPRARAFGAIALHPTESNDGSYRFMSLSTGETISRAPGYWTEAVVSDMVIARVEALAKHQGQPLLQTSNLVVENSPDQYIDEDEFDADYHPPDHDEQDDDNLPEHEFENISDEDLNDDTNASDNLNEFEHLTGTTLNEDDATVLANPTSVETHDTESTTEQENLMAETGDVDAMDTVTVEDHGTSEETTSHEDTQADDANSVGEEEPTIDDVNDVETETHPYSLRGNRARSYDYRFANAIDNPVDKRRYYDHTASEAQLLQVKQGTQEEDAFRATKKVLTGWILTQMTAKAGIRRYGDAARDAMRSEFRQLDEKGVFEPVVASSLRPSVRAQALRCVNLIKEKRCGKIKGRTCADGRPQRSLYQKSETSSPTASSDAIMLTLLVDAMEGRDVATADVAGAYLNAEMDDYVLMRLEGEDVALMCDVNPAYREYVHRGKNGRTVLFLRLARALYGCVKSALLWYQLFSSTLQHMGFKLNPYDLCVANAEIKGAQCTIVWYVDDNKISHVDETVVSDVIKRIESKFGKMTVTRGLEHEFLGMKIVFDRETKTAKITMASYLREAIEESGMAIVREAATPATHNLFEVGENSQSLHAKEADVFRRIVCKLLYVGIRARSDILTALSYLTTRVSKPNAHDYKKLRRLLEYLNGTLDMALVIGATSLNKVYTWVDASYATHHDMRSHTGGVVSFGVGGIICKSSKQKINTKSSTEAELVGVSDYLPNTIWVMNFMKSQGHSISASYLAQDNQSAMKLEQNGRMSAGQRSRHINIRHFWVTDRLKADGITLKHCPTDLMLADFLTKPLQGSLFRKFRAVLLGHVPVASLVPSVSPVASEERVGDKRKLTGVTWAEVVATGSVHQSPF